MGMVGVITRGDIFSHPIATVRAFGWGLFFRAVAPWSNKTFLGLLQAGGFFGAASAKLPSLLERCIELERRSARIYENLAIALAGEGFVVRFFNDLATQEREHAELLEVCRALSFRNAWKANLFSPWQDYLAELEQRLDAAEKAVPQIDSIDAALQLMLAIESSEIDELCSAAVAATDVAFVKRLKPFRRAMEAHVAYIADRLPKLSPQLTSECRKLHAKMSQVRA
jgi:hypothetical protein